MLLMLERRCRDSLSVRRRGHVMRASDCHSGRNLTVSKKAPAVWICAAAACAPERGERTRAHCEVGELHQDAGRPVAAPAVHTEAQLPGPLSTQAQNLGSAAALAPGHVQLWPIPQPDRLGQLCTLAHTSDIWAFMFTPIIWVGVSSVCLCRQCPPHSVIGRQPPANRFSGLLPYVSDRAHLHAVRIDLDLVLLDVAQVVDLLPRWIIPRDVQGSPVCLAAILVRHLGPTRTRFDI